MIAVRDEAWGWSQLRSRARRFFAAARSACDRAPRRSPVACCLRGGAAHKIASALGVQPATLFPTLTPEPAAV